MEFSAGDRFFFANNHLREQLFPNPSDGAAYGSNVFTGSQSFHEVKEARILVIDDETGENRVGLDPDQAKKLVGDCHGKITPQLHEQLGFEQNTPFQFRLGTNPQPGDPYHRLGKGTLAPLELNSIGNGYDLVLPKSSLKGRKNKDLNSNFQDNGEIQPGEHTLTVGLGNKTHAYYNQQSLGPQVLGFYPRGVEQDILPRVQERLEELSELASDRQALIADYLKTVEQRQEVQVHKELGIEERLDSFDLGGIDEALAAFGDGDQDRVSRRLRADSFLQLSEHRQTTDTLNDHLRSQYTQAATGRLTKFKGALLQPSLELERGHFCDPNLPDGEEVIVTRSPVVNSNGVVTLTNTHIPELSNYQGAAFMHPDDAADYLQGDFDGDRIAYELSRNYPNLAAEVKERNQPQNRYPEIKKAEKVPYQGSFEEIALAATEDKIGIIANQAMKAIAQELETQHYPHEKKTALLGEISNHFRKLTARDTNPNDQFAFPQLGEEHPLNQEVEGIKHSIQELAQVRPQQLSSEQVQANLDKAKSIYFTEVGVLGAQLQIAVDGPKSSARPEDEIVGFCQEIGKVPEVAWLADRKKNDIYRQRPMKSAQHGPIDQLVQTTNATFDEYQLQPRPTRQFADLFADVTVSPAHEQQAKQIKTQYNALNHYAHQLKDEVAEASGPRLKLKSPHGNELEVVNLKDSDHPETFNSKTLDIKIAPERQKRDFNWRVMARVEGKIEVNGDPAYKRLGYLSADSEHKHGNRLKQLEGKNLDKLSVEVLPGKTQGQVKAAFDQVRDFAETTRQQLSESDRLPVAAALWRDTHKRMGKTEHEYNKGSAVFAVFNDEIVERLGQLQLNQLAVRGLRSEENQYVGHNFTGDRVSIEIGEDTNERQERQRTINIDGKRLGYLSPDDAQLPVGTRAEAYVTTALGSGVTATSPTSGSAIRITELKNGKLNYQNWQGEEARIEISEKLKTGQNSRVNYVAIAKVNGEELGRLPKESLDQLRATTGESMMGRTFRANLVRDSPSFAQVQVIPDTIEFSKHWRLQTKQHSQPPTEQTKVTPSKELEFKENLRNSDQETQRDRVATVAPVVAELLYYKGENHHTGQHYIAWWDENQNLSIKANDSQKTLMVASCQTGEWEQLEKTNLSEADVANFKKLEQKLSEAQTPLQLDLSPWSKATPPEVEPGSQKERVRQQYLETARKVLGQPELSYTKLYQSVGSQPETAKLLDRAVHQRATATGVPAKRANYLLAQSPYVQYQHSGKERKEAVAKAMQYAQNIASSAQAPHQQQTRQKVRHSVEQER